MIWSAADYSVLDMQADTRRQGLDSDDHTCQRIGDCRSPVSFSMSLLTAAQSD
jgi:hypothetical protein